MRNTLKLVLAVLLVAISLNSIAGEFLEVIVTKEKTLCDPVGNVRKKFFPLTGKEKLN